MKTLYEVLGVPPEADATIIKRAYRELARQLHPDLTRGNKVKEKKFKEVAAAYAVLGNDQRRALYDRELSSASKLGGLGGQHGFGMDFDAVVEKIKTDGINIENFGDVFDDFFSMAQRFHQEVPSKVHQTAGTVKDATKDPESFTGMMEDLFGVPKGTIFGAVQKAQGSVKVGTEEKSRKKP
jgi:DnaJ-class molecular chaperone